MGRAGIEAKASNEHTRAARVMGRRCVGSVSVPHRDALCGQGPLHTRTLAHPFRPRRIGREPLPHAVDAAHAPSEKDQPERIDDREPLAECVRPALQPALDVGEAVAEQLSLALDPYPRAPGVALEKQWTGEGGAAKPFAALDKLRKPSDSSR